MLSPAVSLVGWSEPWIIKMTMRFSTGWEGLGPNRRDGESLHTFTSRLIGIAGSGIVRLLLIKSSTYYAKKKIVFPATIGDSSCVSRTFFFAK